MKRLVFFITLTIVFCVGIALLSMQVYAQKNLTVLNHGFEQPDSGKVTGFDGKSVKPGVKLLDVPAWRVDALDSLQWDSGIEQSNFTEGKSSAFLMGGDPGIYQNLTRRLYDDDILKLTVDAKNNWQGTTLKMELYYLDNDTIAVANRVPIVTESKTLTATIAPYSISLKGSDYPNASGHKLGILLKNVSPDSASWMNIDNVRLTNEDPTIIEVPNYSFELPDSYLPYVDGPSTGGKIKGWNGPGSCSNTSNPGAGDAEIPGWTTDTVKVSDSGIDARGAFDPQEGQFVGFLMGSDTSVWNTTDYTILAGDIITLRVVARNVWAAELLRTELYFIDAGNRVSLVSEDAVLNTDYTWSELSVGFAADAIPACIGKKLGVLLDNTSPAGSSWIDFDLVRINANHNVTSVSATQLKPSVFSLGQNYPNPFNPSTKILYTLQSMDKVRLSVFDVLGREVSVLVNDVQSAGQHEVTFIGGNLSSGIYFYKLQAGNRASTKKMILLK
jgi:hypothetical protein